PDPSPLSLPDALPISNGATIVKLRAFVAGSGDLRRAPAIVSETFAVKHLPLPAVSVIQVGALPMEGAQVILESIAVAKKETNPLDRKSTRLNSSHLGI